MVTASSDRPIFVLGRQHSGNTMLTLALGRHSRLYGSIGESRLLEHAVSIASKRPAARSGLVARHLARSTQPKLPATTTAELETVLTAELVRQPQATVADLMSAGMRRLADGHERWAQKATSYVFYVDDILRAFPRAQLVFMLRNPFDIAASLKYRGQSAEIVRAVLAWNRGVRRALAFGSREPERFLVARYEAAVAPDQLAMRRIMKFLGLDLEPQQLEIPHVNRSESKYTLTSDSSGMTCKRIYYYADALDTAEIKLVNHFVDHDVLAESYPELAAAVGGLGAPSSIARVRGLAGGGSTFLQRTLDVFRDDPFTAYHRLKKRLAA